MTVQFKYPDESAMPHETFEQARTKLRAWSQQQIEHVDNAISDALVKSVPASAEQKFEFERALRDVRARRAMINRDISKLASQSEEGMPKFAARLRTDLHGLTTRVDKMRDAL